MRDSDEKAARAKKDEKYLERFIQDYEPFIMNAAYKTTGRYLTKSDDEWSICLSAFHEAVNAYSADKGAFLPFASIVIKRRLHDYIRKQSRHYNEIPTDFVALSGQPDLPEEILLMAEKMTDMFTAVDEHDTAFEIEAISQVLSGYGFTFFDVASDSPGSEKTKQACAKAIAYICRYPLLQNEIRRTKKLPAGILQKSGGIPPKILEHHRKYIIAGVEIISGDYPILSEYLMRVRRELTK